jgi:Domain of unknown function (DU1801)
MAEAKTQPTAASVSAYLDAIGDEGRRQDGQALVGLMQRVTGCPATMWGTAIVGFDQYQYRYASGREGRSCIVGFSSRKNDLTIYMVAGYDGADALLAELGPHRLGKACLYLKRLSDVRLPVLEQLIARAVAETRRLHPPAAA